MKRRYGIILLLLLFALLVWVFDAVLDYFLFHDGTFLGLLITDVTRHDLTMRTLLVLSFLLFGVLLVSMLAKRRLSEEELRKERDFCASIVDTAQVVILVLDGEGRIVDFNPYMADICGYRLEEVKGRDWFETFVPERERKRIRAVFKSTVADGRTGGIGNPILTKDGREREIEWHNQTLADADGRVVGVLAIGQDVTERKRAEERIGDLAKFPSENPYPVLRVASDGTVLYANSASQSVLEEWNCREGEVVPQKWRGLVEDVLTSCTKKRIEMEHLGRVVSFEVVPVKDVGYVNLYGRDVTEQRELEEQLRQAQKMEAVGRLAGGVAHDFNNLLTAITGYSEMLLNTLEEPSPMRKDIEEINKAGQQAALITRQLLVFSRKQALEPTVLDLNAVVAHMDKILASFIGEDIELLTVLEANLGHVMADPGRMEQVIMNLAANARDAMPRGGKLTIETANVDLDENYAARYASVPPGPYVMLAVSDAGLGMDKETLSRLSEPFFTTKDVGKGTGLGLSTVYGIVKQSGGDIRVYSERGRGTTFKIFLPRIEQAVAEAGTEEVSTKTLTGSETVLVVEDEESVRTLICLILRRKGYTVLEAPGGGDALELCRKHGGTIHLVITDVVMPRLSGPELAGKLAGLRPDVKVLYVSGYTERASLRVGVVEPGAAFLQKPFAAGALARKVREILDGTPQRA